MTKAFFFLQHCCYSGKHILRLILIDCSTSQFYTGTHKIQGYQCNQWIIIYCGALLHFCPKIWLKFKPVSGCQFIWFSDSYCSSHMHVINKIFQICPKFLKINNSFLLWTAAAHTAGKCMKSKFKYKSWSVFINEFPKLTSKEKVELQRERSHGHPVNRMLTFYSLRSFHLHVSV